MKQVHHRYCLFRSMAGVLMIFLLVSSLELWAAPSGTTHRSVFLGGEKLPITGVQNGNWFGGPIAINGDGTVLVVGADLRMFGQPGAAYVFTRSTTTEAFTQAATLRASDGSDYDHFGSSVAISRDGATIVVGRVAIGPLSYVGTVAYLFSQPQSGWADMTETAQLTATTLSATDAFGHSIAVDADGSTVAISAPNDHTDIDATYVYTRPPQGWNSATQTARLSVTAESSEFGRSVAISSTGDTIAVGSPAGEGKGIYVFVQPLTGWADANETARLVSSDVLNNAEDYVHLGRSIAISDDGAVIAAGSTLTIGTTTGKIYVFERGASWSNGTEQAILPGRYDDFLGLKLAMSADGSAIAAAASQADIASELDAGAVQLFARTGDSWATWLAYQREPRTRSALSRQIVLLEGVVLPIIRLR